jgi:hypothetical protein
MSMIEVIKYLRQKYNWSVLESKMVIEHIEALYLDALQAPQLAELKAAKYRAETYQTDLHTLLGLVDYFVAHPAEYAAWKAAHAPEEGTRG